jgi:hypothetical protein
MSWRHTGEWKYSSNFHHLVTRWRWVVSFIPLPLYPSRKSPFPRHPLHMRLGGPRSRSGRCGEEKNITPPRTRTPTVQSVARRYIEWDIPTPLSFEIAKQISFKCAKWWNSYKLLCLVACHFMFSSLCVITEGNTSLPLSLNKNMWWTYEGDKPKNLTTELSLFPSSRHSFTKQ